MSARVVVYCDGCGAKSSCSAKKHAPTGWFAAKVRANGGPAVLPDLDWTEAIVVCSEACKARIAWGRVK